MICSEWRKVELSEVARFSNKRINSKELTSENYISTENLLPNKEGKTKATSIPNGNVIKYMPGQTLLSNIRPYFKKIWYASNSGGSSTDVLVFETTEEIDDRYFFYYLNQDRFFQHVMAGAKGTKMPRGDKQQILKFQFEYPQKNEQKEIAATLSCLDDKIELNNRINKNLEEMAQSIFKRWFVDFEFPDENGNPYKSSGGEMVESELGRIPKRWEVVKIGDMHIKISDFVANGSFALLKQNVNVYDNINYAYFIIRNTDLKSNVFEKYVDEHSYNFLSKTKLFGNEVIISNVGDVGSVFLCPTLSKPMTLGNNIIMIKSENITNYNYFMYILFKYSYGQDLIKSITGGSAQPKFNKTDLKSLKITLPTDNILNEFNIIIEKVFKKRNYNLQEVETLAKLKDSLLPKLMSGEIRVPCEEAV